MSASQVLPGAMPQAPLSLLRQFHPSVIHLSMSNSAVYFLPASVGGDIAETLLGLPLSVMFQAYGSIYHYPPGPFLHRFLPTSSVLRPRLTSSGSAIPYSMGYNLFNAYPADFPA